MITITTKLECTLYYPIEEPFDIHEVIFFDIETTGFSAKTSYLYLIGCMYYEKESWYLTQWLLDDRNSEEELLNTFSDKLKSYKRIIHFNGNGFDLPFLSQKYNQYHLSSPFIDIDSYDIYKKIVSVKKLLPLPDFKLKTVEKYLGIHRKDPYSGGELIKVYASFLGRLKYEKLYNKEYSISQVDNCPENDSLNSLTSNALANILLLHNLEDIVALLEICRLLYYVDFFQKTSIERMNNISAKITEETCRISFNLPYTFPSMLQFITPLIEDKEISFIECKKLRLLIKNDYVELETPIIQGELKYFYDNYKEYYYLPKEDTAIHKSVAMYVDKEFRIKAKPANCYNRKTGRFLPLLETDKQKELEISKFKTDFHSKLHYIEVETIQNSILLLQRWIPSILNFISSNQNTKIIDHNFAIHE